MNESRDTLQLKTTVGTDANPKMRELEFFIEGIPAPGGSKKAFPFKRKDGNLGVAVTDAGGYKTKAWKEKVKASAVRAMLNIPMLEGPLECHFLFFVDRPKAHFNRHGVKPGAPEYPTVRPDCTKLVRSTEDAMTEIVYKDDAQIVKQWASKHYTQNSPQGCKIEIRELIPRF